VRQVDLAVIGAGVAGLSAAATAAAHGLDVVLIERLAAGGQIATVDRIRNYPGFPDGVGGYELGPLLQQQVEEAGASLLLDEVERIVPGSGGFVVAGAAGEIAAKAVLFAAGSHRRPLGLPREAELEGRGVSHCAACDGPFFRGQAVIVAGGGDSAFDEALALAETCGSVTIVHRETQPVARAEAVRRVRALANVEIVPDAEIAAIDGGDNVERALIAGGGRQDWRDCTGIFVYVGLAPNTGLLERLAELDATGRVVTDAAFETSCPGLFAAGDIRSGAVALLASAAGDGAAAAMSIVARLAEGGQ
jgi:thioredoxin reductase (NADPH)